MKQNLDESDQEFETRRFTRKAHIFTWSTVGTIAAIVVAVDILFGWNAKLIAIASLPDKFQKLSDIVWQDHQAIRSMEIKLNMQDLESPKEKDELSVISTNLSITSITVTNNIDP